jgi:hypothetical protein
MADHCALSIRAARRYRWRLAGGRLVAGRASVRFAPNRLERRRADTCWGCKPQDITAVRTRGRIWLVLETAAGTETFRVFGARHAALKVDKALHPGGHA